VAVELSGKTVEHDLLAALEAFLAPYRAEVLAWPMGDVLEPAYVEQAGRRFRVGAASARVHPDVTEVVGDNDPYLAATMLVDRVLVTDAFGVRQGGVRRLPYAWPEEANAVRIAALVTNVLARRPLPFSATAVHLLRDTDTLYGFLTDLAEQRISVRNGRCWLSREGVDYWIGEPAATATPAEALATFERIVRQAAVLGRSLDAVPIPARHDSSPAPAEDVVTRVEEHPLVQSAMASEHWEMWKDVIRGVVLDAEAERRNGTTANEQPREVSPV
jgi:hypothetical protein